ncbi:hypothetical protein QTN25_006818 [Entamoeba marina]
MAYFSSINEMKLIVNDIEIERIIGVLKAVVNTDNHLLVTIMMSFLYEFLPRLHIDAFFYDVILLRLTIAPSFRLNGTLLTEEQEDYDTFEILIMISLTIIKEVNEKVEFFKKLHKGDSSIKLDRKIKKAKIYLNQAMTEFDEEITYLDEWKQSNLRYPSLLHLDMSKVSSLDKNDV